MTLGQPLPLPAALAAVRRLSSSRPLYAVSLYTALSQLLRLNTTYPESDPHRPSYDSPIPQSPPTGCAGGSSVDLTTRAAKRPTALAQGASTSICVSGEEAATTSPWLTGQFIAQVGAHFDAALLELFPANGDAGSPDSGYDSEERDAAIETQRYAEALSRAALHWGLLLLLAAEHSLLLDDENHVATWKDETTYCGRSQEAPLLPDGSRAISSGATAESGSEATAESADTMVREALTAFEIILRISLPTASHMLPNILEWLDTALSLSFGGQQARRPPERGAGQNDKCLYGSQQMSDLRTSEDAALFVSQHIKWGHLSALVSCTLGSCLASGPLRRPVQHLQRVRLLGLLIRGPRVIRRCSRLLAACAVPASTADGVVVGGPSGCARGTVPQPAGDVKVSRADSEVEPDLQRRLCTQTAGILCVALEDLRDILILSTQAGASDETVVTCRSPRGDIRFDDTVEGVLLTAFLPPQLCWLLDSSTHAPPGERRLSKIIPPSSRALVDDLCDWAFSGANSAVAEETPRKAALYLLGSTKALLLSFALNIEGSPHCLRTFGVAAAAADDSVVRQARAILKQVDEFYVPSTDQPMTAQRLELSPSTRVHCVTRLCSLALSAKQVPKAFQVNPDRADSRILLTVDAATAVAELQIAERGAGVVPRCPLTGRLNLPEGLPDEQIIGQSPKQLSDGRSAGYRAAGGGALAYLNDEGSFRMAIQVARILIALIRDVSFKDDERIAGLIVPPLLRILDIPQSEVRFLGWRCLDELVLSSPRAALETYHVPILQMLMGGFPVFNELDTCFDAYLEAYTTAVCCFSAGSCDHSFLKCQDFLLDMSHTVLSGRDDFRRVFLRRTRPLIKFAGESANLRLYDWMSICLEALESISVDTVIEGFRTLEQVLAIGMDVEEFVPQILCNLATTALVAENEYQPVDGRNACSEYLELTETIASVTHRLACSTDKHLLRNTITTAVEHFKQLHSDEPYVVDGLVRWLSQMSARLQERCIVTSSETASVTSSG